MNIHRLLAPTLLFFAFANGMHIAAAQPTDLDYLAGTAGGGLWLTSELLLKGTLARILPRISNPGALDAAVRSALRWDGDAMETANTLSNISMYVFIVPGVFWSPLLTEHRYSSVLLMNLQVVAANGLVTNLIKFAVGRERPYSFFGTEEEKRAILPSNEKYLSLVSGHSSNAFAIATATAYMLARQHPRQSGLIWSTSLALASLTGYLRIAADRHYLTDVLAGAAVGMLIGYFIPELQYDRFFGDAEKNRDTKTMRISITLPL